MMPSTDNAEIGPQETGRIGSDNEVACHPEYGTFVVADVRLWRSHCVLGKSGRKVRVRLERTLPLLFIRGMAGEAILVREVLDWIWKLDGAGRKNLRQKASALGLLYEYSVKVAGWGLWADAEADLLVWNFLACRVGMPQLRSAEMQALPLWRPVSVDVARQDFVAIRQFAEFCRSRMGSMSWLGEELSKSAAFNFPKRRRHMPVDDLLAHLEPYRARFKKLIDPEPAFPSEFRSSLRPTAHATKGDLCREQVSELVERETNPVFRALWILLAGGGIRVSEGLNIWNVDVMPGHMGRFFGSADQTGAPLVLLAHPTKSVYLGNLEASGRSGLNREAALQQRYGLVARPLLPPKHGLHAGWKGLIPYTGRRGDAFVYWIDPDWAKEFGTLVSQIREIRREAGSDLRHPYLFVNAIDAETRGDPLRVGNVEKAFRRACDRVGLVVGQSVPTVHWLRHFYKVTADDMGLDPSERQIMMHHASIGSQEDYGKRARTLHQSLTKLFGGPHAA